MSSSSVGSVAGDVVWLSAQSGVLARRLLGPLLGILLFAGTALLSVLVAHLLSTLAVKAVTRTRSGAQARADVDQTVPVVSPLSGVLSSLLAAGALIASGLSAIASQLSRALAARWKTLVVVVLLLALIIPWQAYHDEIISGLVSAHACFARPIMKYTLLPILQPLAFIYGILASASNSARAAMHYFVLDQSLQVLRCGFETAVDLIVQLGLSIQPLQLALVAWARSGADVLNVGPDFGPFAQALSNVVATAGNLLDCECWSLRSVFGALLLPALVAPGNINATTLALLEMGAGAYVSGPSAAYRPLRPHFYGNPDSADGWASRHVAYYGDGRLIAPLAPALSAIRQTSSGSTANPCRGARTVYPPWKLVPPPPITPRPTRPPTPYPSFSQPSPSILPTPMPTSDLLSVSPNVNITLSINSGIYPDVAFCPVPMGMSSLAHALNLTLSIPTTFGIDVARPIRGLVAFFRALTVDGSSVSTASQQLEGLNLNATFDVSMGALEATSGVLDSELEGIYVAGFEIFESLVGLPLAPGRTVGELDPLNTLPGVPTPRVFTALAQLPIAPSIEVLRLAFSWAGNLPASLPIFGDGHTEVHLSIDRILARIQASVDGLMEVFFWLARLLRSMGNAIAQTGFTPLSSPVNGTVAFRRSAVQQLIADGQTHYPLTRLWVSPVRLTVAASIESAIERRIYLNPDMAIGVAANATLYVAAALLDGAGMLVTNSSLAGLIGAKNLWDLAVGSASSFLATGDPTRFSLIMWGESVDGLTAYYCPSSEPGAAAANEPACFIANSCVDRSLAFVQACNLQSTPTVFATLEGFDENGGGNLDLGIISSDINNVITVHRPRRNRLRNGLLALANAPMGLEVIADAACLITRDALGTLLDNDDIKAYDCRGLGCHATVWTRALAEMLSALSDVLLHWKAILTDAYLGCTDTSALYVSDAIYRAFNCARDTFEGAQTIARAIIDALSDADETSSVVLMRSQHTFNWTTNTLVPAGLTDAGMAVLLDLRASAMNESIQLAAVDFIDSPACPAAHLPGNFTYRSTYLLCAASDLTEASRDLLVIGLELLRNTTRAIGFGTAIGLADAQMLQSAPLRNLHYADFVHADKLLTGDGPLAELFRGLVAATFGQFDQIKYPCSSTFAKDILTGRPAAAIDVIVTQASRVIFWSIAFPFRFGEGLFRLVLTLIEKALHAADPQTTPAPPPPPPPSSSSSPYAFIIGADGDTGPADALIIGIVEDILNAFFGFTTTGLDALAQILGCLVGDQVAWIQAVADVVRDIVETIVPILANMIVGTIEIVAGVFQLLISGELSLLEAGLLRWAHVLLQILFAIFGTAFTDFLCQLNAAMCMIGIVDAPFMQGCTDPNALQPCDCRCISEFRCLPNILYCGVSYLNEYALQFGFLYVNPSVEPHCCPDAIADICYEISSFRFQPTNYAAQNTCPPRSTTTDGQPIGFGQGWGYYDVDAEMTVPAGGGQPDGFCDCCGNTSYSIVRPKYFPCTKFFYGWVQEELPFPTNLPDMCGQGKCAVAGIRNSSAQPAIDERNNFWRSFDRLSCNGNVAVRPPNCETTNGTATSSLLVDGSSATKRQSDGSSLAGGSGSPRWQQRRIRLAAIQAGRRALNDQSIESQSAIRRTLLADRRQQHFDAGLGSADPVVLSSLGIGSSSNDVERKAALLTMTEALDAVAQDIIEVEASESVLSLMTVYGQLIATKSGQSFTSSDGKLAMRVFHHRLQIGIALAKQRLTDVYDVTDADQLEGHVTAAIFNILGRSHSMDGADDTVSLTTLDGVRRGSMFGAMTLKSARPAGGPSLSSASSALAPPPLRAGEPRRLSPEAYIWPRSADDPPQRTSRCDAVGAVKRGEPVHTSAATGFSLSLGAGLAAGLGFNDVAQGWTTFLTEGAFRLFAATDIGLFTIKTTARAAQRTSREWRDAVAAETAQAASLGRPPGDAMHVYLQMVAQQHKETRAELAALVARPSTTVRLSRLAARSGLFSHHTLKRIVSSTLGDVTEPIRANTFPFPFSAIRACPAWLNNPSAPGYPPAADGDADPDDYAFRLYADPPSAFSAPLLSAGLRAQIAERAALRASGASLPRDETIHKQAAGLTSVLRAGRMALRDALSISQRRLPVALAHLATAYHASRPLFSNAPSLRAASALTGYGSHHPVPAYVKRARLSAYRPPTLSSVMTASGPVLSPITDVPSSLTTFFESVGEVCAANQTGRPANIPCSDCAVADSAVLQMNRAFGRLVDFYGDRLPVGSPLSCAGRLGNETDTGWPRASYPFAGLLQRVECFYERTSAPIDATSDSLLTVSKQIPPLLTDGIFVRQPGTPAIQWPWRWNWDKFWQTIVDPDSTTNNSSSNSNSSAADQARQRRAAHAGSMRAALESARQTNSSTELARDGNLALYTQMLALAPSQVQQAFDWLEATVSEAVDPAGSGVVGTLLRVYATYLACDHTAGAFCRSDNAIGPLDAFIVCLAIVGVVGLISLCFCNGLSVCLMSMVAGPLLFVGFLWMAYGTSPLCLVPVIGYPPLPTLSTCLGQDLVDLTEQLFAPCSAVPPSLIRPFADGSLPSADALRCDVCPATRVPIVHCGRDADFRDGYDTLLFGLESLQTGAAADFLATLNRLNLITAASDTTAARDDANPTLDELTATAARVSMPGYTADERHRACFWITLPNAGLTLVWLVVVAAGGVLATVLLGLLFVALLAPTFAVALASYRMVSASQQALTDGMARQAADSTLEDNEAAAAEDDDAEDGQTDDVSKKVN